MYDGSESEQGIPRSNQGSDCGSSKEGVKSTWVLGDGEEEMDNWSSIVNVEIIRKALYS